MNDHNRTQSIVDRILPAIQLFKTTNQRPFILAISGLQGSGKSYLATELVHLLSSSKYKLHTIAVSLDDFYLPHAAQLELRVANPSFDLLRNRGQPSTHDAALAQKFFAQFNEAFKGSPDLLWIPKFDKSAFNGDGDRAPREEWSSLSRDQKVDVIIFEGWCVGFRPLPDTEVQEKWQRAKAIASAAASSLPDPRSDERIESQFSTMTLASHELDELLFVNKHLEQYCKDFMGPQHVDFIIHLDTADLANVYTWRIQQEHALVKAKGSGMSDQAVVQFVQRYMPAYELYLEHLRLGFFRGNDSAQKIRAHLRVVLDIDRNITRMDILSTKPSA